MLRKKRNNVRGPKCSRFAPEADCGQSRGGCSVDDHVRLSEAERGEENKGGGGNNHRGKERKRKEKERRHCPLLARTKWRFRLHLNPVPQVSSAGLQVTECCTQMLCRKPLAILKGHCSGGHLLQSSICPSFLTCVCMPAHMCAHRVIEIILKGRRGDHHGLWFTTNVYHPARQKATCPGRYRRYWMLRRMSLSAGVIRFFHGDPNAFFQFQ